jgi:hypothetical protein
VVSSRLPRAVARVQGQVRSCGICGGQCGTGAGFIQMLRLSLPVPIQPTAPHSSKVIIIIIIQGWYNRPKSNKWIQSLPTVRNKGKLKIKPRETLWCGVNSGRNSQFTAFTRTRYKQVYIYILNNNIMLEVICRHNINL